jgi:uncharacterized membrane protein
MQNLAKLLLPLGRRSLGTTVFGGILVSTILSLFVVPVLYVVMGRVRDSVKAHCGLRDRFHQLPENFL